jgi:hypothetical protein
MKSHDGTPRHEQLINGASQPVEPTLLQIVASPTSTAGAIVGGTIGAFTVGPIGAVAGMVAGTAAAIAVEHFVGQSVKHRDHMNPPSA